MIAIVMAGGRATRFGSSVEKGLLTVGEKNLLTRSLDALQTDGIEDVAVAVTSHTPRTREAAEALGARVIGTAGKGYHEDIIQLLEGRDPFLTVNVDAPFIGREHVAELLTRFDGRSLAAVVREPATFPTSDEDSIAVSAHGSRLVWVGLNIVTPDPQTATAMFDDPLLAVNINNEEDLIRANRIARELGI